MVRFGGKKVGQVVAGFGGNGVGQILAAMAAALLLRLFSGPGPAQEPESEPDIDGLAGDGDGDDVPVEDKVVPVTIRWRNITCSLSDKSLKSVRFLLKNVCGEAKPGRLLAIMGPSGSGKTTLLNVLAGQLMASRRLRLSGLLEVNGRPSSNKAYRYAYVRQDDLFFSQLTVRETLSIAAELQLPGISSVEERDKYVNNLLFKLGLVNCADTNVGDAKVRGISGGEKKRLSLACELMASPSVIFADEPTTGLDAFQAEKVMETLQQLAQDGHTVICSIHQPRGSVYTKFDDIVLLTEGALVYAGPARDEPLAYFSKFGYFCPDHENPAEFLADLISVDYRSAESVSSSQKRIDALVESFSQDASTVLYATALIRKENYKNSLAFSKKAIGKKKGSWWRQFWLLLKRAWMQASRDAPTNKVRAGMSIASAIIFGSVFWRMGRSQTSIPDRMGLLQVAAISTAMAALTKTVGVFPKERAIVDRERMKGSYALGPYLLSKLIAEIPIGAAFPLMFGSVLYPMARLHPNISRFGKFCGIITAESFAASAMGLTVGAMVPTTEAAMAVGPSLMTVFIVFGGYYVNAENTPFIFRWIPRVSLIRWAFQGLCINEFNGLEFDHQNSFDIKTGEQALERLSFGGSRISDTVIAQSRVLLFWYCTTYLLLEKRKPRYQRLESPLDQIKPLQHDPLDTDQVEQFQQHKPPPVKQLEAEQQLDAPSIDPVQAFILEGAK
ncbi:ABC_tran domain-containing protein/ABC2_membrane domain-containing protein [Cephalotus follicularis]|uniref:ABC_tran domain-containing protein/ABC2_membrane domain-containing protein n=1 Tax=Cephalotus follicularis TaxID=3775 RepID=A0A1Q3C2K0_CEPFO|nr:ABC_tran domain-containing protein/ABC2_membrane domain-containing protein [Cephalotus follicularis]